MAITVINVGSGPDAGDGEALYTAFQKINNNFTDLDTTKAESAHAHAIADVTGLQTALDGKAASVHTHGYADISDLAAYTGFDARYYTESETSALLAALTVAGLADVTLTSPTNGQVLTYNGTAWVNAGAAGGGVSALDDLSDVVLTTPSSGQVLSFNGTSWVNAAAGGGASVLDDLTDVAITSVASGEVLGHDGVSWLNRTLAEAGIAAATHSHGTSDITDLASYTGLDVRYYTESEVNGLLAGYSPTSHSHALGDLSNVTLTTPASGEVLSYNGSAWVNAAASGGASALSDLTDVTLTTPSNGQVLTYNGTGWVNAAPTGGGDYLPLTGGTLTGDLTFSREHPHINLRNTHASYLGKNFDVANYQGAWMVTKVDGTTWQANILKLDWTTLAATLFGPVEIAYVPGTSSDPVLSPSNAGGVYWDQYGNFRAKSTVGTSNTWNVIGATGTMLSVPVGTSPGDLSMGRHLTLGNMSIVEVENIYLDGIIYSVGDTDTYLQFHAADQFRIVTANTEVFEANTTDRILMPSCRVSGTLRIPVK